MVAYMKKQKLLALILAFFLCSLIIGCNTDTDEEIDDIIIETQEDIDIDVGELETDHTIDAEPSPSHEAIEAFLQLAWEMENGDKTSTRERLIEIFGEPQVDDDYLIDFQVTSDVGVRALIEDNFITYIVINPFPDFFIDESLQPDTERLRLYEQDSDGLTLEYFEELFGTPGFISSYGSGLFTYAWRSSIFEFSVDVDADHNVSIAFFWDILDQISNFDEIFEQELLIIPENITQVIYTLAHEIQRNDGQISQDKAIEIVGLDYSISNGRIIFPIIDGVDINAVIEDTNMVEQLFMSLTKNFYFFETIPVGMEELEAYIENPEDKTLDELTELLGSPGILMHYTFGEFIYNWITPDITIQATANPDGDLIDFYVSQFVG